MFNNETLFKIARDYGTPSYIYKLEHIQNNISQLNHYLPNAKILYAVKANPNGAILKFLAQNKVGAEVISLGELARALNAGIDPQNISLDGPRQDPELISAAIKAGIKWVSLDSYSQWQLWQQFDYSNLEFFIRLNPALDPKTHQHLATGAAESKFGMTLEETEIVAKELKEKGQLAGFHVHAGSQISDFSVYDEVLARLRPLFEKYGGEYINIGGGFHVPDFDFEAFAAIMHDFSKSLDLKIVTEPGRYLVADSGFLLTKVLHKKTGALNHLICDAGMADLIRPALYNGVHPITAVLRVAKSASESIYDVDGPLCENADRLARGINLPDLDSGDLLLVSQVGAYGFTMSSNYASSFRPAEVTIINNETKLVKKRETVEDLLRLELD